MQGHSYPQNMSRGKLMKQPRQAGNVNSTRSHTNPVASRQAPTEQNIQLQSTQTNNVSGSQMFTRPTGCRALPQANSPKRQQPKFSVKGQTRNNASPTAAPAARAADEQTTPRRSNRVQTSTGESTPRPTRREQAVQQSPAAYSSPTAGRQSTRFRGNVGSSQAQGQQVRTSPNRTPVRGNAVGLNNRPMQNTRGQSCMATSAHHALNPAIQTQSRATAALMRGPSAHFEARFDTRPLQPQPTSRANSIQGDVEVRSIASKERLGLTNSNASIPPPHLSQRRGQGNSKQSKQSISGEGNQTTSRPLPVPGTSHTSSRPVSSQSQSQAHAQTESQSNLNAHCVSTNSLPPSAATCSRPPSATPTVRPPQMHGQELFTHLSGLSPLLQRTILASTRPTDKIRSIYHLLSLLRLVCLSPTAFPDGTENLMTNWHLLAVFLHSLLPEVEIAGEEVGEDAGWAKSEMWTEGGGWEAWDCVVQSMKSGLRVSSKNGEMRDDGKRMKDGGQGAAERKM